jgi:hypothetical protein
MDVLRYATFPPRSQWRCRCCENAAGGRLPRDIAVLMRPRVQGGVSGLCSVMSGHRRQAQLVSLAFSSGVTQIQQPLPHEPVSLGRQRERNTSMDKVAERMVTAGAEHLGRGELTSLPSVRQKPLATRWRNVAAALLEFS